MLNNFNSFKTSILLESILKESRLYFSSPFRDMLVLMKDNDISIKLLSMEGTNVSSDVTFVDLSKENGYLTFLPMVKAQEKIKRKWNVNMDEISQVTANNNLYSNDINSYNYTGVYGDDRNQIKIGKFINKVFSGIYQSSDVESFVNELKALQAMEHQIEIVSGKDINTWYTSKNYLSNNSGSLVGSCMSDNDYLGIYIDNPEVCRLVILTVNNRLIARALVWKINTCNPNLGFEYYMDRVYYYKDHQEKVLQNYAKDQGWAYKNKIHSRLDVFYYNGKEVTANMTVKIKPGMIYVKYPYLDTFKRWDPKIGMLYNDSKSGIDIKGHLLVNTTGKYQQTYYKPNTFMKLKDWWRNESIQHQIT
jgi:hypothetical protein